LHDTGRVDDDAVGNPVGIARPAVLQRQRQRSSILREFRIGGKVEPLAGDGIIFVPLAFKTRVNGEEW
jgi:hypothetical protein